MSAQAAAARTPGAKRAGPGEYVFDLGKINHIKGGPDYSSVEGGVVEGDRMIVALMRMPAGTSVAVQTFARTGSCTGSERLNQSHTSKSLTASVPLNPKFANESAAKTRELRIRDTSAEPHSHPNEQWIYILEGTFKARIGDDEVEARPGSVVYVPSNVVHSAKATPDADVVFFTVKDASHSLHGTKAGS